MSFMFTDDSALNATTKANMQKSVDEMLMACENFSLTIGTKKDRRDSPASAWKTSTPTSASRDND